MHEPTAVTAVMQSNFDVERALDKILSQGNATEHKYQGNQQIEIVDFKSFRFQINREYSVCSLFQFSFNMSLHNYTVPLVMSC